MNRIRTTLAALGLGAILVIGALVIPMSAFAAGNTISVSPSATSITPAGSTGSSFTVTVKANGSVDISGAGAALNFDKSRLQLTAIAKDATEVANGVSYAGFPTGANTASFIAAANASGQIPTIAWTYTDGASAEVAGVDHGIFTATFQVIAAGDSTITPVIVAGVGGLLDGTSANYGASLTGISVASDAVSNTAPTQGPTGTPTPTPTPTPVPASAAPGSGTTNVNGTLDSGFLGLAVPASITIPLARNTTNTVNVPVTVYSNIIWNLNVADPKATNTGFMTDGAKVLANSMHVQNYDSSAVLLKDVNLTTGGLLASGANSMNVSATLSQFVAPQDQAGNYGIQVLFSAVSGF